MTEGSFADAQRAEQRRWTAERGKESEFDLFMFNIDTCRSVIVKLVYISYGYSLTLAIFHEHDHHHQSPSTSRIYHRVLSKYNTTTTLVLLFQQLQFSVVDNRGHAK